MTKTWKRGRAVQRLSDSTSVLETGDDRKNKKPPTQGGSVANLEKDEQQTLNTIVHLGVLD